MSEKKRSAAFQAASARWKSQKSSPATSNSKDNPHPDHYQPPNPSVLPADIGQSKSDKFSPPSGCSSRAKKNFIPEIAPLVGSDESTLSNDIIVVESEKSLPDRVILVDSSDDESPHKLTPPTPALLLLETPSQPQVQPTVSLESLMGSKDLLETFQFNFSVDFEFAMLHFHSNVSRFQTKVTFVLGSSILKDPEAASIARNFNVHEIIAPLPNKFASHHTKMMINFFNDSVEVVIMTCNLTKLDVLGLGQMVWRSGRMKMLDLKTPVHSPFKDELQQYLKRYKAEALMHLATRLDQYDFRPITVELVASAPGKYNMARSQVSGGQCGYGRLHQILVKHNLLRHTSTGTANVLAQVTSIAYPFLSLAGKASSIFSHVLCPLITSSNEHGFEMLAPGPDLFAHHQAQHHYVPHIVYPTARQVAQSHVGFASGQALHFNYTKAETHRQQYLQNIKPYLRKYIGTGSANTTMPHLKVITCDNADDWRTLRWVFMGSHNLSKQAWGMPNNYKCRDPSQYTVDSYELGVVIFPPQGKKLVPWHSGKDCNIKIAFPFKLPPESYSVHDEPWSMHRSYPGLFDRFGQEYVLDFP